MTSVLKLCFVDVRSKGARHSTPTAVEVLSYSIHKDRNLYVVGRAASSNLPRKREDSFINVAGG